MVIRLRNIRGVPDLEHTGEVVVLVAVMGPLPKEQLYFWNLPPTVLKMHPPVGTHDTDDEICNGDADLDENIVIPGAAANGTIIITLVQRSAIGASNAVDTFIGQTFIVMRNIYAYEGRAAAQRWFQMPLTKLQHRIMDAHGRYIPMRQLPYLDKANRGSVKMQVEVLNSLFHICGNAQGPHPDMMHRKEAAIIKQNNSKVGRRAKWWVVLAASHLWLYRAAADQQPKLELHVRKIRMVPADGGELGFSLVLPDERRWLFMVRTKRELKRWLFAMEVARFGSLPIYKRRALDILATGRTPTVVKENNVICELTKQGKNGPTTISTANAEGVHESELSLLNLHQWMRTIKPSTKPVEEKGATRKSSVEITEDPGLELLEDPDLELGLELDDAATIRPAPKFRRRSSTSPKIAPAS